MTDLIAETRNLSTALSELPVPAGGVRVYDPLRYMRAAHERWLDRHVNHEFNDDTREWTLTPASRPYLILGMNPGPWGMVQTGVPFGDVQNARMMLGLPPLPSPAPNDLRPDLAGLSLHPQRPVQGLDCKRREASGERLWAGLSEVWESTLSTKDTCVVDVERVLLDAVLRDCFAMNYCSLAYFAEADGKNLTPEDFVKSGPHRDPEYVRQLDALCGPYLRCVMKAMRTRVVLAVGRYAERKALAVAPLVDPAIKVVYLTHPSPLATRSAGDWAAMARTAMSDAGVLPTRGAEVVT